MNKEQVQSIEQLRSDLMKVINTLMQDESIESGDPVLLDLVLIRQTYDRMLANA